MLPSASVSPQKKLKSPIQDLAVNTKTSITCSNVPEALFDTSAAKKHFSKFGKVQRIRLLPKRQMCVIEYEQPIFAERALLNAGAYDGFMFDVTRTKPRVRRRSKREDDPDWVPDSDVEEELSAMSGVPTYSLRSPKMDVELQESWSKPKSPQIFKRVIKTLPRKSLPVREKPSAVSQSTSGIESPVSVVTTQTSLSTMEAASELVQLRLKVSLSPDEQWRILDARDRILRAWGGAGSRVKVGGATIGTCPDMCPEKELLHRQSEYQLMTLESVPGPDGQTEVRAVKQYSRSSADQEIPMCYELRPAAVLMRTCAYLLHEIADTKRQVTLADWFHFMWDRLRGIRKDIAQQALCSAESIILVEMCARFHAHCAARLADLEHTQFDQKLNTDNLTKCLQTLKHMYADVSPEEKPREAEFRGYIALLNLGDANFWWEIKQQPEEIQKSSPIIFAIKIFNALDNNNYVRFFRLISKEATYLQACILLRYFNDVRARALARIVKAYAPRGGSRYPILDLMNALAFESEVSAISFVNHYGLRSSKIDDCIPAVVLDRNQFIEDSDPYPLARSVDLIESKRTGTVAEVIAGGELPKFDLNHVNYTSFTTDGKLKETALLAEDQGYNTINDSNKALQGLRSEVQRMMQSGKKSFFTEKHITPKVNLFKEPEPKRFAQKATTLMQNEMESGKKVFTFTPAIPVAPAEEIQKLPLTNLDEESKNMFSFSKPQETLGSNDQFLEKIKQSTVPLSGAEVKNIFSFSKPQETNGGNNLFSTSKPVSDTKNVFGKPSENKGLFESQNLSKNTKSEDSVFKRLGTKPSFNQPTETRQGDASNNLFGNVINNNLFSKPDGNVNSKHMFANKGFFSNANAENLFAKPDSTVKLENSNIFTKSMPVPENDNTKQPSNIFGTLAKLPEKSSIFGKSETANGQSKSIFIPNGGTNTTLSPSSLFKNAANPLNCPETQSYSIFQSKNRAQTVADNILNSMSSSSNNVYEFQFKQNEEHFNQQRLNEIREKEEENKLQEQLRINEERKLILRHQEEERRKAEELKKQKELKLLLAKRKEEEQRLEERRRAEEARKQEELRKQIEQEKKAEMKKWREEQEKIYKKRVDSESAQTIDELINEVNTETVKSIMKEEVQGYQEMLKYAEYVTEEIIVELCSETCHSETKAEKFLTEKLMRKWYQVWRRQFVRNRKRRDLLEDTPVWLTENTALQEAGRLRRLVEDAALRNMNAIHRGYRFVGELRQLPSPQPYNIMEIIKSPLLKRMKQINYPYDKCFFWKVTLVSPGDNKWLFRRINTEKWILDAFSDRNTHEASQSLIHVAKQSWNHLMDFAISVSLICKSAHMDCSEAVEGSNGILIYSTEHHDITETIKSTLDHKYPYQIIPVTVLLPKTEDTSVLNVVDALLKSYVIKNCISAFKIYMVDPQNISESLNACTKSALKWMARKCPRNPPLEIDYLKSLCQRYLGNEIWSQLKSERDVRMQFVRKDLDKLVSCYNTAVDKLTEVITQEDLFNYSPFPLEFKMFLDDTSPYPKPHEFIPSSVNNSENTSTIRNIMQLLKLPSLSSQFHPLSVVNVQQQMRAYCNQIGWFENPEEVVCKIVAVASDELSDLNISSEDFTKYFSHFNFIDFLNIIVYEKISRMKNISNRFAIYKKDVLDEYRNINWLYETNVLSEIKPKCFEYEEDELDYLIEAKRRKLATHSMEYLMLEDKDCKLVEENINANDESISQINDCEEAVKQLEQQLEFGKIKSMEFENMLKAALADC